MPVRCICRERESRDAGCHPRMARAHQAPGSERTHGRALKNNAQVGARRELHTSQLSGVGQQRGEGLEEGTVRVGEERLAARVVALEGERPVG
eukprot:2881311-Prymnesium_polylepis.1